MPSFHLEIYLQRERKIIIQDAISREITLKASQERVYHAITDLNEIVKWFPDSVEGGTLEVGQEPIFSFEGASHQRKVHIEAADPFGYFAYRWVPGPSGEGAQDVLGIPNTLVEFSIEEVAGGTRVTVKESGFASLPLSEAESSFKDNSGGWGFMVERLEKLLN